MPASPTNPNLACLAISQPARSLLPSIIQSVQRLNLELDFFKKLELEYESQSHPSSGPVFRGDSAEKEKKKDNIISHIFLSLKSLHSCLLKSDGSSGPKVMGQVAPMVIS